MLGVIDDDEHHGYQQFVAVFLAKIPEGSQVFVGSNYCYSVEKSMLESIQKAMPNREDCTYLLHNFRCS